MKRSYFIISKLLFFLFCLGQANAQLVKELCKNSVQQNTSMWWVNPLKDNASLQFAFKSNKFNFKFDYTKLDFAEFYINNSLQPIKKSPHLTFGIETYGKLYPCNTSSLRAEDCQLIHTGRFMQHRFINWIPGLNGCNPYRSGLDIVSWGDRLSLTLRIEPTVVQRSNSIVIIFEVPTEYKKINSTKNWITYVNPVDGSGYVITKTVPNTEIFASNNIVKVRLNSTKKLQPNVLYQTGLIIYPVSNMETELTAIINQESNPPTVTATQYMPTKTMLCTKYDPTMGWHSIKLRNDVSKEIEKENDRMERVSFTIENKNSSDAIVRLNFAKENEVYAIAGISSIVRDQKGFPLGIPVQLSKNWHTTDFNNYESHLYKGPWFHGLTTLRIAANSKITLEYTGVNAHWGGIPAASHAQLCLVGWGNNQQWDQSAIGAWGESICYEPDLDQASAAVLDVRPLLTIDSQNKKWNWTGNVGGADFLNIRKTDGKRAWHSAIKTHYKRYCPNLTEVIYQGEMFQGNIKFQYTTSIGRSDDLTRGVFKIKMNVMKEVTFNRLDIFQFGAATYHYGFSKKIALGNENGLILQWTVNNNEKSTIVPKSKKTFTGRIPWVFMYDSSISNDQLGRFIGADRGFIIRSWKTKLNGKTDVAPHWQEYKSTEGSHGDPCSIMTVTLPDTFYCLSPGDYIEAEIEMFVTPQKANDYYGPNINFKEAMSKYAGQWRLAHREVIGNDIKVNSEIGITEASYPIIIKAEKDQARFKTIGGIGYVPFTFKGLSNYKKPVLYIKKDNEWKPINQSKYGNDYWQTDFDLISDTWEVTFNVNMDSPNDKTIEREFRFELLTQ